MYLLRIYPLQRSLDIHKQWSHDLFNQKNEFTTLSEEKQKKLASNPLFCRLMGIKNTQPEKELLNNPLYMRMQGVQPQTTIKGTAQGKSSWTIKGASGATTVIVSNLAEGTTAEDVKVFLICVYTFFDTIDFSCVIRSYTKVFYLQNESWKATSSRSDVFSSVRGKYSS